MPTPQPEQPTDEVAFVSIPAPVARFVQLFGWDGVLPVFVALGPIVARTIFAKPPGVVVVFLIFAPPVAALIRAHIGWHQIARRCGGRAPLLRQLAMAAAIVLLLAFEGSVGILTFADRFPPSAWWFPVGVYAGYLAMIIVALRPANTASKASDGDDWDHRSAHANSAS